MASSAITDNDLPIETESFENESVPAINQDESSELKAPVGISPDMAIEVAIERTRTSEALKARDAAVDRLVEAHESIRQKTATIELLQQNIKTRTSSSFASDPLPPLDAARMKDEIASLERTIVELRIEIRTLKENTLKMNEISQALYSDLVANTLLFPTGVIDSPSPSQLSQNSSYFDPQTASHFPTSDEPADVVAARNAILAGLPLPDDAPNETLSPLSIPPSLTIQEFISTLSGALRTSLNQYRLFYANTTMWCPEREEHGYFYTPAFKCNTNPRVITAHRWSSVDVIGRMNKPTVTQAECFFNKDGTWYYAGVYTAFRLIDLTTKEWAALPPEVTQLIVKETVVARKNISPQNIYETNQLYAAGALKVACVALQCVGFNNVMYRSLLEQARTFTQSKWAAGATGKASPIPMTNGAALGSSSAWNASSNAYGTSSTPPMNLVAPRPRSADVVTSMANMNLGRRSHDENRNENTPVSIGDGRKK
ncbi:hypothetical protein H0H93_003782 [Arthromyces matolae]|nr:hypothetical protein H0H93_003782 [Arthromyces matolae]